MGDRLFGASTHINQLTALQMRQILQSIAEEKRRSATRTFVVGKVSPALVETLISRGFSVSMEEDVEPSWDVRECRVWVLPTLRDQGYCEALGDVVIRRNPTMELYAMALTEPTTTQNWLGLARVLAAELGC